MPSGFPPYPGAICDIEPEDMFRSLRAASLFADTPIRRGHIVRHMTRETMIGGHAAIDASAAEEAARDDLVDRLRIHDVYYIGGGSQWRGAASPYRNSTDATAARLIGDLAVSTDARLRDAVVTLLLRHPEYTSDALEAARLLVGRARLVVEVSIVAAAALQSTWIFSLDLYMPGWSRIDADALATRLDVPVPHEDYGRSALAALSDVLNSGEPFVVDHVGAWEDVALHVLDNVREEPLIRAPT